MGLYALTRTKVEPAIGFEPMTYRLQVRFGPILGPAGPWEYDHLPAETLLIGSRRFTPFRGVWRILCGLAWRLQITNFAQSSTTDSGGS